MTDTQKLRKSEQKRKTLQREVYELRREVVDLKIIITELRKDQRQILEGLEKVHAHLGIRERNGNKSH